MDRKYPLDMDLLFQKAMEFLLSNGAKASKTETEALVKEALRRLDGRQFNREDLSESEFNEIVIEELRSAAAERINDTSSGMNTGAMPMEALAMREMAPMASPSIRGKMKKAAPPSPAKIGLSTGGAKDVDNFRENLKNGYLPKPSSLTVEGLFYDYLFDTGDPGECNTLFAPVCTAARTCDPLTDKWSTWLCLGLNSGINQADFKRKRLNLVIVLDISGSMDSPFDEYFYDGERGGDRETKSKLKLAEEAIGSLLKHLDDQDRLGIVLFDSNATDWLPLRSVKGLDLKKTAKEILEITTQGSTDISAGLSAARAHYRKLDKNEMDPAVIESRVILLTDEMPNTGATEAGDLANLAKGMRTEGVNLTVIGVGVDFQAELVERMTKVRGANYYTVKSGNDFRRWMDKEFEYMVTPLVFDLVLALDVREYAIKRVCGSPEAGKATGEVMRVATLFPSEREEGESRGGIVLAELIENRGSGKLTVSAAWEDREGKKESAELTVTVPTGETESWPNSGVRKGVLLAHYATLLKTWMEKERGLRKKTGLVFRYIEKDRVFLLETIYLPFSPWEEGSMPLRVLDEDQATFAAFRKHFALEASALKDKELRQELEVLDLLAGWKPK